MLSFATRMLRDKAKSFFVYSLAAVGFLEMYIVLFPSISKQSDKIDQMMKAFPPEFFKAMNMDPSSLSFSTMESYLSTEYMSFLWPILAIIFIISMASYIAVREIDKGTIETLMSLPVSRTKVFVERYFAGLLMLMAFTAISLFGAIPLAELHGANYVFDHYVTATIGSFFFVWAVYSLTVLISVIVSEKSKASMISGGMLMVMYVVNVVSGLQNNLKDLQYVSFFHYFNGPELLNKNLYPEYALVVFGVFAVLAFLMAAAKFKRRDLSV